MASIPASFFGLTIDADKKYSQTVEDDFRLTMASLSTKLPNKPQRTSVIIKLGDREFTLCSLTPGTLENQSLDLTLVAGEEISFHSVGNCSVDLTGNHIVFADDFGSDDEDDMEMMDHHHDSNCNHDQGSDEESDEMNEDSNEDDDSEEEEELDDATIEAILAAQSKNKRKPEPIPSDKSGKKAKVVELTSEKEAETKKGKKETKEVPAKKEAPAKKETPVKKEASAKESPAKESTPAKRTLSSGIIVEDSVVGTGPVAKSGSKVAVRYIGRLTNGKVFDSNTKGSAFTFKLGKGEVIKGWDLGVAGMHVGGSRKLTIPPHLAYGGRGAPPDIAPNATLVFEIKLLDVKK
ncbi:hypothetical protein BATDEDRAFT_36850 [Batrachochytrium dendrobatidis JAM81]|uniref:peptidylprolyl isomerase n=1 Tax=Batrachochytrium dendrobatidis (strain JAM81 / FGSC 10211) TaxID=684364 RepID=F4P0F4_BATDJ|nr:uncharacterized protein BATDEDRAFT_36850 [Batrachochytrium dendrobatidis JAM81]EGF81578.1 hypothetical protein BATDEDRAFT_36850 [Batrachochytrium dendrobatidis JAM81]KAK5669634.1 peptidylprolyl isomerase fpr3 [Batrachochytrium dendrobatidis]|eukprot:XP_006678071.1 hypothetical protein BATDEDRAFT_36850 [Batrachochytrium dendrobatidis JAM81]